MLALGLDVGVGAARLLGLGTLGETEVKGAMLDPMFVDDPDDVGSAFESELFVDIELLRLRLLVETAPLFVLDMAPGFEVEPLSEVE